ncbi:MAG: DNA replication/repair protein RecF [Sphingomonas sp.]|nr:DNA replication/repair protein RecF [Sphingomonas sp.]
MPAVTRLALTDFRSYATAAIEPGPGFVLLFGENGTGKTNVLEAVSLLTPGRGLRGAPLTEIAREGGPGGFAVAAELLPSLSPEGGIQIGTGTALTAPERRQVRINGAPAAVNSLSGWLSVLWLTPGMDRMVSGTAGERRRFLDRLVLALEPSHAHHSARYEAAMRARNKLLAEVESADGSWLTALEAQMAEHGAEVAGARSRTVAALEERLADAPDDAFARASIALDGWIARDLAVELAESRGRDAAAGRALSGPNRQDLAVTHRSKSMPASRCSTGEQKALLLGLVLAHADLVTVRRGAAPILLLDEVVAHLDPERRSALFARLEGRGQVWMSATEAALFDGIGEASRFHVQDGRIMPI